MSEMEAGDIVANDPQSAGEIRDRRRLLISERAAQRIAKVAAVTGGDAAFLRVSVSGGGCSGFKYSFTIETETQEDDRRFERDGAAVVIDETSLELLSGAELDFVEDLSGAQFQIRNPNASSSCGCGMSFSV